VIGRRRAAAGSPAGVDRSVDTELPLLRHADDDALSLLVAGVAAARAR